MNTFGWCKNSYLLGIEISTPTGSQNREFEGLKQFFY